MLGLGLWLSCCKNSVLPSESVAITFMQIESKQPHTSSLRGRQILERRKELEQELVDMLKVTKSDFTLDHVRDAIFHEEDNDDMIYPHTKLKPCITLTFWKVKKIISSTLAQRTIFVKGSKSIMMAKFFQPKLDGRSRLYITRHINLRRTREKEKRVWN